MIETVLTLLPLLAGLAVLAFAYASAHSTPLPRIGRPEFLWGFGIALLLLSGLVALTPDLFRYSSCDYGCNTIDGPGSPELVALNANVKVDFTNCVDSAKRSRKEELLKLHASDPKVNVDQLVKAEVPDIEASCRGLVLDRCRRACYDGVPPEASR